MSRLRLLTFLSIILSVILGTLILKSYIYSRFVVAKIVKIGYRILLITTGTRLDLHQNTFVIPRYLFEIAPEPGTRSPSVINKLFVVT